MYKLNLLNISLSRKIYLINKKRVSSMSKIVGSDRVKRGMAEMQKAVSLWTSLMQNKIAEEAGAVAVMALERVHQIFVLLAVLHVWRI